VKYHLDRAIRFSDLREHTNLYPWSLHELSSSGERLGRDLIPWDWTLRFEAHTFRLLSIWGLKRSLGDDGNPSVEWKESTVVVADLQFDAEYSSESRWSRTKLSMLGTEREISQVRLRVRALQNEEEGERCKLFGFPSYTSEIDFHNHTFPDTIEIEVAVSPLRLRTLCEIATYPHPISASITVSRVSGLYSEWSPAIGTDSVRILTADEAHVVEGAPEGEGVLPRLGDVGEFELLLSRHSALNTRVVSTEDSEEDGLEVDPRRVGETVTTPELQALQNLSRDAAVVRRAISSMKAPLWIAVILIGLLLIF